MSLTLLLALALRRSAPIIAPRTFFVSLEGNDTNDGLSLATPWQTTAKVNAQPPQAGDNVLFRGGDIFSGFLEFDETSWTLNPTNPVVFGSYGIGKATISSGTARGFYCLNNAGVEVNGLDFVGDGATDISGVELVNAQAGTGKLQHILCFNCEVSGYGRSGIEVRGGSAFDAGTDTAGFEDVVIDSCVVHDCCNIYVGDVGSAGILVHGRYGFNADKAHPTHLDVTVSNCESYDNPGTSGAGNWTGCGIFVGEGVQGGLVTNCVAHHCGSGSVTSVGGPVGIWTADADSVVIQFCEAYAIATGNEFDGDGFDIDGGATNCTIQYCYSHDNAGHGYLLYQYPFAGFQVDYVNNTMRYCISENDALTANGAISIQTDGPTLTNVRVYNNIVYSDKVDARIIDVRTASAGLANGMTGLVANNIVYSANGGWLVHTETRSPAGLLFRGNCYYSTGTWRVDWGNTTYNTLAAWRAATSQEVEAGLDVGTDADPLLVAPGNGGTVGGYVTGQPTAYQTQAASPMRDAGLDLLDLYGVDPGGQDFYGNVVPVGAFDIGAFDGVLASLFWAGSLGLAQAPTQSGTFPATAVSQAVSAGLGIIGIRHNLIMTNAAVMAGDYSAYDAQWAAMAGAGQRLYLTLFDGSPGATAYPGDDPNVTTAAAERTAWAAIAVDAAQYLETTYPGLLAAVEVWNEPDGNWPIPADRYVLLAEAVFSAFRAVPALDHIPIVGPATAQPAGTYWQALINDGLVDHLDWISIHSYSAPHLLEDRFDAARAKLALVGADATPIFVSEYGAETSGPHEIAGALTMLMAQGAAGASYFPLQDFSAYPSAGLMASDGAAKTHTAVWNTWHASVGEAATYVGREGGGGGAAGSFARQVPSLVNDGTDDRVATWQSTLFSAGAPLPFTVQSHVFDVSGSPVRVVWATGGGTPSVDVAGSYTAKDVSGTAITAGATQVLGASPIYLFGDVSLTLTAGQDVLLAGNSSQFSDVQGQDGWSYHVLYAGSGLYDTPTAPNYDSVDNRWELAGEGNWTLGPTSSHPETTSGSAVLTVRRWTVPAGVTRVKVTGTWARSSSSGNGSGVALWQNTVVRFRRAALLGATANVLQVFDVSEGDKLEFRVGPGPGGTDINFDNTSLNILIYQTADATTAPDDA